jgi:hypothetical protein
MAGNFLKYAGYWRDMPVDGYRGHAGAGRLAHRRELAFREHDGGHTDAPDGPAFLRFAQRYLGQ